MGDRPGYRDYDEQEVANLTLDDSLGLEKTILYGWYAAGDLAIALKVDGTGAVVVTDA